MVRPPPELQIYLPPQFRDEDLDQRGIVDATPVEVETFSHVQGDEVQNVETGSEKEGNSSDSEEGQEKSEDEEDMIGATRWQKEKKRKERFLADSQQTRKLLLEEPVSQDQHKSSDPPAEEPKVEPEQKPLSRAERRKKIKEEILAAGEGESYKGYRRRKW